MKGEILILCNNTCADGHQVILFSRPYLGDLGQIRFFLHFILNWDESLMLTHKYLRKLLEHFDIAPNPKHIVQMTGKGCIWKSKRTGQVPRAFSQ